MAMWKNDDEMFALMKEKLYTPVVGDILDQMGYKHQFLPASIRPLAAQVPTAPYILPGEEEDKRLKVAGYACTVLENDVFVKHCRLRKLIRLLTHSCILKNHIKILGKRPFSLFFTCHTCVADNFRRLVKNYRFPDFSHKKHLKSIFNKKSQITNFYKKSRDLNK